MFLPITQNEMNSLGWKQLDVILITGDAYIDSPYIGVSVIGRVLLEAGYKVGIISQPDVNSEKDITRLGEPALFWGVTSGCVDSMISNRTALGKPRRKDDLTPGGVNNRRPDRAVIAYTNLIRRYFKNTVPIVLGGIEASLRRISHYDYTSDSIRRSVLFDAKADVLVYGMGEKTVPELAKHFQKGRAVSDVRGICYIGPKPIGEQENTVELPAHDVVCPDKSAFIEMFRLFYDNSEPSANIGKKLIQQQDTRYLIQNPPQLPPAPEELDAVYELPFVYDAHPYDRQSGEIRALDTMRFSIVTHRGCFGGCRFCAIAVHQGRQVVSRSEASILREAERITKLKGFKGIIQDAGGPTANMYGMGCKKIRNHPQKGMCIKKNCLTPFPCRHLDIRHNRQMRLLEKLRNIPGVRKVMIASGIRFDLILNDKQDGRAYLEHILCHHVSGQMKVAPEHSEKQVLSFMGKSGSAGIAEFKRLFDDINKNMGKKQFLTYYFMVAHPGCTLEDMRHLKRFVQQELRIRPEQMQIFTPSPSTWSTVMYHTGIDPFTGEKVFVEKNNKGKEQQKKAVQVFSKSDRTK